MGGEAATRAEPRVGHALGGVRGHELGDVLGLPEHDVFVGALNLHAQEVRDFALVLHVPASGEVGGEAVVERVLVRVRAQHEQVVDVTAHEEDLVTWSGGRRHNVVAEEHTRIEDALLQPGRSVDALIPPGQPGEQ